MQEYEPFEIVWRNGIQGVIRPDGSFMPIIMGAAPDGDDGDDGDDGNDNDSDDDDEDDDDADDGADDIKDPKAKIHSLTEANARLARKLEKKDGTISDMEKRLKQIEDKDKDEVTKKGEELESTQKELTDLQAQYRELEIENVLLSDDNIVHLSARRRKMIIREVLPDLEVEDDGDSNLQELLEKLEKDDPGLFDNGDKDDDDSKDDADTSATRRPKTKTAPTGNRKKKDKGNQATEDARIRNKFSAIRR